MTSMGTQDTDAVFSAGLGPWQLSCHLQRGPSENGGRERYRVRMEGVPDRTTERLRSSLGFCSHRTQYVTPTLQCPAFGTFRWDLLHAGQTFPKPKQCGP